MKGGLANTPLGIVFLELREILRGQGVSDVYARALSDVQGDLERLYILQVLQSVQMHEDSVLLARHELDAEDFHCPDHPPATRSRKRTTGRPFSRTRA